MAAGPLRDRCQALARDLLLDAVFERDLNARQLSELLAERGVEIGPKALSRRLNRGSFDAGFFLMCLAALGAVKIDLRGELLAEVQLQPERAWEKRRSQA